MPRPLASKLFRGLQLRLAVLVVCAVAGAGSGAAALTRSLSDPWTGVAFAGGVALVAALFLAYGLQRALRPLDSAFDLLQHLGRGEMGGRLEPSRMGELAPVGEQVNEIAASFAAVVERLRSTSDRMQQLPVRFDHGLHEIEASADDQEAAVEETASLMADINASIKGINREVEALSHVTEEASSSILEMGSSIDEVARSAGSMHQSVDSSTASIHQISASIRQVAESADAVEAMAEEAAAAITQMDRAIQQVSEHVREASVLTERVSHEAEDGSGAVATTIDGIETIRSLTRDARDVLERLAGRIAEIGEILDVIGSINEETNLLSLNAAIIAAQAGEQGKAFAVVANHVKTLAQRTATATQEIGRLIGAVQDESRNAVQAMGSGIEAVEAGVERSRRAGSALETIRNSAHQASSRVAEIARAATEQTRNSAHVAQAAQRTSEMVQQMSGALAEQRRAGENLLRNAEAALELCRQVHRSTEEQRQSSRFVRENIGSISEMIRAFQENTASHERASDAVSATASRILEVNRKTTASLPALAQLAAELRREASTLADELAPFAGSEAETPRRRQRDEVERRS
jgi:methyl-accepting chemotaxis protein